MALLLHSSWLIGLASISHSPVQKCSLLPGAVPRHAEPAADTTLPCLSRGQAAPHLPA